MATAKIQPLDLHLYFAPAEDQAARAHHPPQRQADGIAHPARLRITSFLPGEKHQRLRNQDENRGYERRKPESRAEIEGHGEAGICRVDAEWEPDSHSLRVEPGTPEHPAYA